MEKLYQILKMIFVPLFILGQLLSPKIAGAIFRRASRSSRETKRNMCR